MHYQMPTKTASEMVKEDSGINKYLIFLRDVELSPFELIADGPILEQLYTLSTHDGGPIALSFSEKAIPILTHLGQDELGPVGVIITPQLKDAPGHKILMDRFNPVTLDTANQIAEDARAQRVASLQSKDSRLNALIKDMEAREKGEVVDQDTMEEGDK